MATITRDDLVKFHQTWFKPNNATLVVVGDTTLAEIQPKLEALFASWKPRRRRRRRTSPTSRTTTSRRSTSSTSRAPIQSVLIAGIVAPGRGNKDEIAIETMNTILGGAFISRINMNLREDKHWSYGAGSFLPNARAQRIFIAYAPVQTDKTKESLVEIQRELDGFVGARPPTAQEVATSKNGSTLTLPGRWGASRSVARDIAALVRFHIAGRLLEPVCGTRRALDCR